MTRFIDVILAASFINWLLALSLVFGALVGVFLAAVTVRQRSGTRRKR